MLVSLVSISWGHPFESQFVGHKSTLAISPTHLEVSFDLEIPLPLVERAYQESGHTNKRQWLSDWIHQQQNEIEQNLWLDVNSIRQHEWNDVEHSTPIWKEESKFLVFSTILKHQSMEGFESLLLLDQVFIGEPSVYWTDVLLARQIVVVATDTIDLNGNRYTTHLKRWEMEDSRREVRIAMKDSMWSRLEAWWQSVVLKQDEFRTMKEAFLPQDTWRLWMVGETPLLVGLISILIGVVAGIKGSLRTSSVLAVLALCSLAVPVLPVSFRLTLMVLLVLILPKKPIRMVALGALALLLCQPSWILLPAVIVGTLLKTLIADIK